MWVFFSFAPSLFAIDQLPLIQARQVPTQPSRDIIAQAQHQKPFPFFPSRPDTFNIQKNSSYNSSLFFSQSPKNNKNHHAIQLLFQF
jgi:hypothetical protein